MTVPMTTSVMSRPQVAVLRRVESRLLRDPRRAFFAVADHRHFAALLHALREIVHRWMSDDKMSDDWMSDDCCTPCERSCTGDGETRDGGMRVG